MTEETVHFDCIIEIFDMLVRKELKPKVFRMSSRNEELSSVTFLYRTVPKLNTLELILSINKQSDFIVEVFDEKNKRVVSEDLGNSYKSFAYTFPKLIPIINRLSQPKKRF